MFRFFTTAKWAIWAYLGSFVILTSIWVQVQIDVMINEWFGEFYDMIQKALGEPNAVTMEEYTAGLMSFGKLAAISITLGLAISCLGFGVHLVKPECRIYLQMLQEHMNGWSKMHHLPCPQICTGGWL